MFIFILVEFASGKNMLLEIHESSEKDVLDHLTVNNWRGLVNVTLMRTLHQYTNPQPNEQRIIVGIQVEFSNGSITTLNVEESEVEKCVRMLWTIDDIVNVTVIEKTLQ